MRKPKEARPGNAGSKAKEDLEEILDQALSLLPPDRPLFLERACGGNAAMRAELESLLEVQGRYPELLCLPLETEAPAPTVLGPYRILREIGRGGMGVVYLAEDPRLARLVALKVLPERLARDESSQSRFKREARLLAAMNHPNIATLHSLEEAAGVRLLTMEYVDGASLEERLAAGPLPLEKTLVVARAVARALEAAHEKGIIHRDLKPSNIILGKDGRTKVLDFGVARSIRRSDPADTEQPDSEQSGSEHADEAGLVIGTPGYMSPEQALQREVDERADVWAFGCLLFEMLTGKQAFPNARPRSGAGPAAPPVEAGEPWKRLPEQAPPRMIHLVQRCLAENPEERLGRIRQARREIEEEMAARSLLRRHATARAAASARQVTAADPVSLPHPLDRFIGRRRERAQVRRALEKGRLVTLTGIGGAGKSRLALETGREIGERFADGVRLVELSSLRDPDLLPRHVAAVFGLGESQGERAERTLLNHLRDREVLLLIDQCEHLLESCGDLTRALLRGSSRLRILATSREPLGAPGEAVCRVSPLSVPDPEDLASAERPITPARLRSHDAVRLFVDRATAADGAFRLTSENARTLGEICRRLDGIPLALELAAAHVRVLPLGEMLGRMRRIPEGKAGGSLPWQRDLADLIRWSHDLLEPPERALFRRLSVFAGGWSLAAAEAVCSGRGIESWDILDLLTELLNKSLVELDPEGARSTGRARYRMLETIRVSAEERLKAAGEAPFVRRRHLEHYLDFVEEAEPHLTAADQMEWMRLLDADHDNLRATFRFCRGGSVRNDPSDFRDAGLKLAGFLGRYWLLRGHWSEGRTHLAQVLQQPYVQGETSGESSRAVAGLRAKALHWAANLAERQGDLHEAERLSEESLDTWRALGDSVNEARLLNNLANIAQKEGRADQAEALYLDALALHRVRNDRLDMAHSLNNLGALAASRANFPKARGYLEESVSLKRELGDRVGVAAGVQNLGALAALQRDHSAAQACLEEALSIYRDVGLSEPAGTVLTNLGLLAIALDQPDKAESLLRQGLAIRSQVRDQPGILESYEALAELAATNGEPLRAARLLGAADSVRHALGLILGEDQRREQEAKFTAASAASSEAWAAARLLGRSMASDQALAFALSRDPRGSWR